MARDTHAAIDPMMVYHMFGVESYGDVLTHIASGTRDTIIDEIKGYVEGGDIDDETVFTTARHDGRFLIVQGRILSATVEAQPKVTLDA
jgi:hypothetical protein